MTEKRFAAIPAIRVWLFIVAASSMLGCQTSDADLAKQAQIEATTPECDNEEACAVMWEAAQYWVRKHGASQTDRYDPNRGATAQADMDTSQILMSARRTKTAKGYRFEFLGRCLNLLPCRPSVLDEHVSFNRFVKDSFAEAEVPRSL